MTVSAYNTTASLNTAINGVGVGEGMSRSDVNNAIRELMADIKAFSATVASGTIAITAGGTGAITAPLALTALGGLSAAYLNLPQSAKASAFTFDLTQPGGHVYYTGGAAAATVPAFATVAFPVGTAMMIVNNGSGALAIARAAGVAMKWAATAADADRSLAVGGMASLINVGTNLWFISGANIS